MAHRKTSFQALLSSLQKPKQPRGVETRNILKFYLIVCEGETEQNYFEYMRDDLPKGVVETMRIEVKGIGRNTQSLITEAKKLKSLYEKSSQREIDKVWVVFDKDSFPKMNFNEAINSCKNSQPEIGCAWTNEAFEFWFLLHFEPHETAYSRKQYKEMIEERLKKFRGKDFKYSKGVNDMYVYLKEHGNIKKAVERAEKLDSIYNTKTDYANHNPRTKIHLLIKEIGHPLSK